MKQNFIVNVESITEEGLHITTAWDAQTVTELLQREEEFRVCSPLSLKLSFALICKRVIIEGNLDTLLEITCVSCLSKFKQPLEIKFRYILWPQTKATAEESEKELHEEDIDIEYYQGEVIELKPLVREQLYLALPQNPHCKKDCPGLCPLCGNNLNEQRCDCLLINSEDDSPFNLLKRLKQQ